MFDALIKVGGSVCHTQQLKAHAPQWAALARRFRLLFVAGGGLFADQVRALDQHLGLSDGAAHWMAIAAMDQSGYLLADFMPGVQTVYDADFALAPGIGRLSSIFLPFSFLRQVDPLPHSWEVTSDSIAAWLAGFAGVKCLVLLKDVPGVYQRGAPDDSPAVLAEITRGQLAEYEVVDPYFVNILPPGLETWILSGYYPDRLARLLETGGAEGTRIVPEPTAH